jgi:hypothetical protein
MTEGVARLPDARRLLLEAYQRDAATEWIQATGRSMIPLVRPGTWMLVEFGATPQRVGEIVIFHRDTIFIAHRVVARRVEGDRVLLVTKGDGEPYRETPLETGEVTGVVRGLALHREGALVTLGCAGFSGRAIARVSNLSGRGAALVRRVASHLPDPARRPATAAGEALARVASRGAAFPFALVAQHALRSPGRG